ncbi:hypothetical protein ACLB2K_004800 [Fragaria x ananassa]
MATLFRMMLPRLLTNKLHTSELRDTFEQFTTPLLPFWGGPPLFFGFRRALTTLGAPSDGVSAWRDVDSSSSSVRGGADEARDPAGDVVVGVAVLDPAEEEPYCCAHSSRRSSSASSRAFLFPSSSDI